MTRRTAIATLRRAFAALTKKQRANLGAWAKSGKPILCGEWAALFFSEQAPAAPPGGV